MEDLPYLTPAGVRHGPRGPGEPRRRGLFSHADSIALASSGVTYVAHPSSGQVLRVEPDGKTRPWLSWRGDRPRGRVPELAGLAIAPDGTLYASDRANHLIWRVAPGADQPEPWVGGRRGWVDGTREQARLRSPGPLCCDDDGHLWLTDEAGALRDVSPDGQVRSLPVLRQLQPTAAATTSWWGEPGLDWLVAKPPHGTLYVLDRRDNQLYRLDADGRITPHGRLPWPLEAPVLAPWGRSNLIWTARDREHVAPVPGWAAHDMPRLPTEPLGEPTVLASSAGGALAVGELGGARVRIFPGGGLPAVAAALERADALAYGPDGRLWAIDAGARICEIGSDGAVTVRWDAREFARAWRGRTAEDGIREGTELACHGDMLYVLDRKDGFLRSVDPGGVCRVLLDAGRAVGALVLDPSGEPHLLVGHDLWRVGDAVPRVRLPEETALVLGRYSGHRQVVMDGLGNLFLIHPDWPGVRVWSAPLGWREVGARDADLLVRGPHALWVGCPRGGAWAIEARHIWHLSPDGGFTLVGHSREGYLDKRAAAAGSDGSLVVVCGSDDLARVWKPSATPVPLPAAPVPPPGPDDGPAWPPIASPIGGTLPRLASLEALVGSRLLAVEASGDKLVVMTDAGWLLLAGHWQEPLIEAGPWWRHGISTELPGTIAAVELDGRCDEPGLTLGAIGFEDGAFLRLNGVPVPPMPLPALFRALIGHGIQAAVTRPGEFRLTVAGQPLRFPVATAMANLSWGAAASSLTGLRPTDPVGWRADILALTLSRVDGKLVTPLRIYRDGPGFLDALADDEPASLLWEGPAPGSG